MKALLLAVIFCATASLSGATTRPSLASSVLDSNGGPLAGVTVMVYHARVKIGYSTFCPSCYIGCGKRVITDARGAFEFKDLASDLSFTTLLADRVGYVPEITKSIDLGGIVGGRVAYPQRTAHRMMMLPDTLLT
jgi:hypothetical protein